ncbi:MAG: hypothetical protein ABF741_05855 [Liquorilactobacillus ghanensis]
MNQKEKIIESYFKLSDLASNDNRSLNKIVHLFANDAIVEGSNGFIGKDHDSIVNFFQDFFKDNKELRHLCQVSIDEDCYKAEWSVAGRKNNGKLFALHGYDTYKFDKQNKIKFLQVKITK